MWPSGSWLYLCQSHCQCPVTWLGGNTCGFEGHGRFKKAGRRTPPCRSHVRQKRSRGHCQRGNVYLSDHQHFFSSADPGEYDRLSQPVWQPHAHGDRRPSPCDHIGDNSCGGGILQGKTKPGIKETGSSEMEMAESWNAKSWNAWTGIMDRW